MGPVGWMIMANEHERASVSRGGWPWTPRGRKGCTRMLQGDMGGCKLSRRAIGLIAIATVVCIHPSRKAGRKTKSRRRRAPKRKSNVRVLVISRAHCGVLAQNLNDSLPVPLKVSNSPAIRKRPCHCHAVTSSRTLIRQISQSPVPAPLSAPASPE